MAASSSITLSQTMEFAKRLNFNRQSAIGNSLEPALTSANTILQTILGAPFSWRWNRTSVGFITVPGQQDYTIFNYTPLSNVNTGWFTVDANGNSHQCATPGKTGSSLPTWNQTAQGQTIDGSVTWVNLGNLNNSEISSSYSFSWIEHSSVQSMSANGTSWRELESKLTLALEEAQGRPSFISAETDDGLGNITFRMSPVPDKAYPVVVTMQQKPPLFTGTDQTWSPVPDEYSHIYNWGFLSMMWLFADDPRFAVANSKFIASLLSAHQGLDATQLNIFLQNWQYITGQPQGNQINLTQGSQARGA